MYTSARIKSQRYTPGGMAYLCSCTLVGGFFSTDVQVVIPDLSIGADEVQQTFASQIATYITGLAVLDALGVPVVVTPNEVVLFAPGSTAVTSDPAEFLILDRSGADLFNAASFALAVANATARAAAFQTVGWSRYVVTADISLLGSATALSIVSRVSGKSAPVLATATDWSPYGIDDIDKATGISTSPQYQITFPALALGRQTRSFQVWGTWAAPVVWVNGAGARGIVYTQRFGS